MIFIDPPYNTGTDFIYKDNYTINRDEYRQSSNQFDESGYRLFVNVERNGQYHTDWLNMIYPRLKIARDLLTETGVIFITIDDNEIENLKKICSELFGEPNFVGNIIWQSRTSISNDDEISTNHNHILVYSKNRSKLTFSGDDIDINEYINPDNDPRGPWKLVPLDANHAGGDTVYPIKNPKTGESFFPPNGRIWSINKADMQKLMDDGRVKFGLKDDSAPKRKLYYYERIAKGDVKTPSSLLLDTGSTKTGTAELVSLFDNQKVFDYPKPTTLIKRLIKFGKLEKDDILLDFFSGSGTSADAIMRYNIENGTKLRFILVQLNDDLDKNLKLASSDGKKTIKTAIDFLDSIQKPHSISEIGKERIRRVAKLLKKSELFNPATMDFGFRNLKLDTSNMNDIYYKPIDFDKSKLTANNIKTDRTPEDLLFQVMLELGVELSSHIEIKIIEGTQFFFVNNNFLIACFDPTLNESSVTAIAKLRPYFFMMHDATLFSDTVADNYDQIFEHYSPDTRRKVI